MYPLSLLSVAVCLYVAPAGLVVAAESPFPAFPALTEAGRLPEGVKWLDEEAWGDFNLRLTYKSKASAKPVVLVVFNRVDEANHYRLTVSRRASSLERVQAGLSLQVGRGAGLGSGRTGELLLKRRGQRLELFRDAHSVLVAYDGAFEEGGLGYASLAGPTQLSAVRLQPVQSLAFTDDFMRAEGEAGDWTVVSGRWETKSLLNPLRSANAFTYSGTAHNGPAIALAGEWFWDDYRLSAAAKTDGDKPIGLIAGWRSPQDYVLFEWTCRTGRDKGARRLVLVENGRARTLTESPGGFRLGQWYRLALTFRRGFLLATVDDMPVCASPVPPLPGGKVGLYTKNYKGTYYDDAAVDSAPAVTSNFGGEGELQALSGGAWRVEGGEWVCRRGDDGGGLCEAHPASPARALLGTSQWADYLVRARVAPGRGDKAGLLFCYQDEGDHLSLELQGGDAPTVALVKTAAGQATVLGSAPLPNAAGPPTSLSVDLNRGVVRAQANGHDLFEVFDAAAPSGRAGLFAEGASPSQFNDFAVEFPRRDVPPVFTLHETFEGEVSMANWAAAQSDWRPEKTKVGEQEVDLQWHRATFWGETEIQAEANLNKGSLGLVVSAAQPAPNSGYQLTADKASLVLLRQGQEVARSDLANQEGITAIRLRRGRNVLVASVEGEPRLTYTDAAPLSGTNVGWYATGNAAAVETVQVFNPNVATDMFRTAPVDWREAGGWWAVSRRWQCDPRWSFFSGLNAKGPAVLWYKRPLQGDQDVEFAAGVKMARQHGDYAAYGRDLNLVLCADGKDVSTGYSFVFAGWGNKKNAIVRGTQVVAEAPPPELNYKIHRQWFLLRGEKRGAHVAFYVDNQKVCEYEDPAPLTGDRMALWTYNGGMMVSRFRVCAQEIGPLEGVDEAWPVRSRTFYEVAK